MYYVYTGIQIKEKGNRNKKVNKHRIYIVSVLLLALTAACTHTSGDPSEGVSDSTGGDMTGGPVASVVIDIEELKSPDKALPTVSYDTIIAEMMHNMG